MDFSSHINDESADMTLTCPGKVIRAHRAVLHSVPYFQCHPGKADYTFPCDVEPAVRFFYGAPLPKLSLREAVDLFNRTAFLFFSPRYTTALAKLIRNLRIDPKTECCGRDRADALTLEMRYERKWTTGPLDISAEVLRELPLPQFRRVLDEVPRSLVWACVFLYIACRPDLEAGDVKELLDRCDPKSVPVQAKDALCSYDRIPALCSFIIKSLKEMGPSANPAPFSSGFLLRGSPAPRRATMWSKYPPTLDALRAPDRSGERVYPVVTAEDMGNIQMTEFLRRLEDALTAECCPSQTTASTSSPSKPASPPTPTRSPSPPPKSCPRLPSDMTRAIDEFINLHRRDSSSECCDSDSDDE